MNISDAAASRYQQACDLVKLGRDKEAIQLVELALSLQPEFAEAHALAALILERNGQIPTALKAYMRVAQLQPNQAISWFHVARLMLTVKQPDQALAAIQHCLTLDSVNADAQTLLSSILSHLGRWDEAAAAAETALRIRPGFVSALFSLGNIAMMKEQFEDSFALFSQITNQKPDFAEAFLRQTMILQELCRYEEALSTAERAVALGLGPAKPFLARLRLKLGDYERGWEAFESRWPGGKTSQEELCTKQLPLPLWQGPGSPARRVLVINDRGLGSTFQFGRYLPLMQAAGVETYLHCEPKLRRLVAPLVQRRLFERNLDIRAFDAQIALASLPYAFKTLMSTIPSTFPYLHAEPELVEKWRAYIGTEGLRIGCVWQCSVPPKGDPRRAFPLQALAPIAALPGVRLVSLQKGFGEEQLDTPLGFPVLRLPPEFDAGGDAFIDTAAAMMSLDLIITCDTSIVHLAGALGRRVWVPLKRDYDWRWLVNREDSPWYPTVRLFAQKQAGNWDEVFQNITSALQETFFTTFS